MNESHESLLSGETLEERLTKIFAEEGRKMQEPGMKGTPGGKHRGKHGAALTTGLYSTV